MPLIFSVPFFIDIVRYGMDEKLGYVTFDSEKPSFLGQPEMPPYWSRRYSEETAREIDGAGRTIVQTVFGGALRVLEENRGILEWLRSEIVGDRNPGGG